MRGQCPESVTIGGEIARIYATCPGEKFAGYPATKVYYDKFLSDFGEVLPMTDVPRERICDFLNDDD